METLLSRRDDAAVALVDARAGRAWTYGELRARVDALAARLEPGSRRLAFVYAKNDVDSIVAYLAAGAAGHPVCLLDAALHPDLRAGIEAVHRPEIVISPGSVDVKPRDADAPHADLSLLLPTSGTTGSAKLVRLSGRNVRANARSIVASLDITPDERAITSLPIHYAYGLSVVNSHLAAGATLVVTDESVLSKEFWEVFRQHGATSFAGVPYTYEMLDRIAFLRMDLPSLRTMTQAGGHLPATLVRKFHAGLAPRGARLVVMYGQTEATARMTWLPPERLPDKAGAVGVAIPDGRVAIDQGEIVYEGPNVMMGYAEARADLARGDDLRGTLRTGDLGRLDEEGLLHVEGRLNRFCKVFGLRVSLDDVERRVRARGPAAAIGARERVVVFCQFPLPEGGAELREDLSSLYGVHRSAFDLREVGELPLTPRGKIDYAKLQAEARA